MGEKVSFWAWIGVGLLILCGILLIFSFIPSTPTMNNEPNVLQNQTFTEPSDNLENFSVEVNENSSHDDYPDINESHWGKMPIKYYILNPEDCGIKIVNQINESFKTIQNETGGVINFQEGIGDGSISLECFSRYGEDVSIAQRAGNTYAYAGITYVFDDGVGNVIAKGEIKLFRVTLGNYYGRCGSEPVTIIHEILHLFGFEDNGKPRSIMYRYVGNCEVEIDEEIIDELKETYTSQSQ